MNMMFMLMLIILLPQLTKKEGEQGKDTGIDTTTLMLMMMMFMFMNNQPQQVSNNG